MDPFIYSRFIRIGEVPTMVKAFAITKFETAIQDTARFQRPPQACKGIPQLALRHMQQASAGPDAIIEFNIIKLVEALYRNNKAQQLARMIG